MWLLKSILHHWQKRRGIDTEIIFMEKRDNDYMGKAKRCSKLASLELH
jgi:hypothetical protein